MSAWDDSGMLTLYSEQVKIGSQFISCGEGNKTLSKFLVDICYLADSAAEVISLSKRVHLKDQFLVEER